MQQTIIDGIAMWSAWQPGRNVHANSYFIAQRGGNAVVDPPPLLDSDFVEIAQRGGVVWVVITNCDTERGFQARACAERFGAKVAAGEADVPHLSLQADRVLRDGDEFCGARIVELRGFNTPGQFALFFRESGTVLVGDALWGDPAGSLRLPDDKLSDPPAAVLSLRKLRAHRPRHLLVGHGASIFNTGFETLTECLEARTDAYVQRVNVDELEFAFMDFGVSRDAPPYNGGWAEIGFLLGATKLGYAATRLEPGQALCPLHWHTAEEEICVVLDGTPTVRTPHGDVPLRRGDLVAFPTRAFGAHKLFNSGKSSCTLLLIANTDSRDVIFYPDSRKVYVDATGTIVRDNPHLDYFDGEMVEDGLAPRAGLNHMPRSGT